MRVIAPAVARKHVASKMLYNMPLPD